MNPDINVVADVQSYVETEGAMLEDLAQAVPIFKALGLNDRTPVVNEDDSNNPGLRAKLNNCIKLFQEKYETEDTSFRASESVEGARKRTLIFGIENEVYRCLDTASIVQKGI